MIVAHPSIEVQVMLARRIEGAGCSVETCSNGNEALELSRNGQPQAVLVGVTASLAFLRPGPLLAKILCPRFSRGIEIPTEMQNQLSLRSKSQTLF